MTRGIDDNDRIDIIAKKITYSLIIVESYDYNITKKKNNCNNVIWPSHKIYSYEIHIIMVF